MNINQFFCKMDLSAMQSAFYDNSFISIPIYSSHHSFHHHEHHAH